MSCFEGNPSTIKGKRSYSLTYNVHLLGMHTYIQCLRWMRRTQSVERLKGRERERERVSGLLKSSVACNEDGVGGDHALYHSISKHAAVSGIDHCVAVS